jgi:hypothetical protein
MAGWSRVTQSVLFCADTSAAPKATASVATNVLIQASV